MVTVPAVPVPLPLAAKFILLKVNGPAMSSVAVNDVPNWLAVPKSRMVDVPLTGGADQLAPLLQVPPARLFHVYV